MAEKNSNIDLVFRNGLQDYEVLPPVDEWANISSSIHAGKNRRYSFMGSIAVVVLIFAFAGSIIWMINSRFSKIINNNRVITLNQTNAPSVNNALISSGAETMPTILNEIIVNSKNNKNIPSTDELKALDISKTRIAYIEDATEDIAIRRNSLTPITTFNIPNIPDKTSNRKVFEIKNVATEMEEHEKWKFGATIQPAYYSKFNFNNDDAGRDYINEENVAFSYSGGISFGIELGKRLTVQTGLSFNSLGQEINGVASFAGFAKYNDSKSASDFSITTASGTIKSTNRDIYLADNGNVPRVITLYTMDMFDPLKANLNYIANSIIQNMKYIEIPVLVRYKVVDRRLDINMVGGLSYNILVSNSSYIKSDGIKYTIGSTEGLSPVTLSSSVGMGMEYRLSERMTFSVEPLLRYYVTPLGGLTGSNIHPYSLGILSGFFYNF